MTTSDPERPPQPFGRTEYPSLENPAPQPDPNPPVDYPADAGLPPPLYPPPYPGGGLPRLSGLLPGRVRPVPAHQASRHERQGDRGACHVAGGTVLLRPAVDRGTDPRRHRDARDQTHRPGRLRDGSDR